MILRTLIIALCIASVSTLSLQGQENRPFYPGVFWSNNGEKGAIIVSPNEVIIIGADGEKYGRIMTDERAYDVYISPDGEKVAYTTSKGLWLLKLKTKEKYLISKEECVDFHWNKEGLSFMFMVSKENNGSLVVKLFWADGDGKNLKQVYP